MHTNADLICQFSRKKDKHRDSNEIVRYDEAYKGVRTLFIQYIIEDVLKFDVNQIKFSIFVSLKERSPTSYISQQIKVP